MFSFRTLLRNDLRVRAQSRACRISHVADDLCKLDLRVVLSRLHVPVDLNISVELTVQAVEFAMKGVEKSMETWIDDEIKASSRVRDLLVGRLEKDKDTGKFVKKSLDFRHYLRVKQPEHRKALTKMVLSSHSLAVERRRWKERGKRVVPQQWRLCSFCYLSVEDPAHAMFKYEHQELAAIRQTFLTKVEAEIPGTVAQFPDAIQLFKGLLPKREITPILAKLAYDVLKIFDAEPMLVVYEPTTQAQV